MATLLVSDTSVLIDLARGGILEALFRLPFAVVVPDLLFEKELQAWDGPSLTAMGLQVLPLKSEAVSMAQAYLARQPRLSTPDAFALALARSAGHMLLAGDGSLRVLAAEVDVRCHGVLWVFDRLEEHCVLDAAALLESLTRLSSHRRCRLPKDAIEERLARYRRIAALDAGRPLDE